MSDLLVLNLPLRLVAGQDINERPLPRWWGEAVHRLVVAVIASQGATLAEKLEANDGLKPFTASTLHGPFPKRRLDPDGEYHLRLTALDQQVADIFLEARETGVLKAGAEVELDFLKFQVQEKAEPEETLSYQTLANTLFASQPPPKRLTLRFTSPTVFKSGGKQVPYPIPDMVFGSLLEHWNASASAPTPLPDEARKYARECLKLTRFSLHSRVARLYGEPFHGFVGRASFTTLNYDRYWMSMMNMLAQYAYYAGVGAKTTLGLGQSKFIPEESPPPLA